MQTLEFDKTYLYDTLLVGVTIPVVLSFADLTKEFKAKVDTGSSYCIFERKHGELLGIDIESGEHVRVSAAMASFDVYGHDLTLRVLDIETHSRVYFAKDESFTRNVLGRQGWLDRVKLGLIDYEGKFFLSAYEK